tara:strand:- start:335 stop:715 length:381 start_codon:yes stop_codon:yes gene_type:complete
MSDKKKKKKLTGLEKNEAYAEAASTGIGGKYSPLAAMIRGASSLFHDKEKVKKARKRAKGQSNLENLLDNPEGAMAPPFAHPSDKGIPAPNTIRGITIPKKKKKFSRGGGVAIKGFGNATYSNKDI